MSENNILLSTSITTPNTSDTMSANITVMPFTQVGDSLPNTFTTAKGLISSKVIEEHIKQSQHNNSKLVMLNGDEVSGINLWQYANKLYDISQKHTNNDLKTKDAIQAIQDSIAKITKTLQQSKTQYENVFQVNTLDGIDISITQHVFSNGKKQIKELLKVIDKAKADATILANNEVNKMLTMLIGANVYLSHASIVLYFANKYLSRGVLLWVIRICFSISPQGAVLFLIFITLSSIYKLITKDDTLKIKIYEFYCVLNAILRQVHYHDGTISALVNFNQNISGNVIIFDERALKYLTSPLSNRIDSLIDPSMLDKAIVYNLDLVSIQPQTRNNINISITSLLKQSNLIARSSQNNKKRLFAFSTFPNIQAKGSLGDNDIINTSAFKHLKNIATQFSNFLFIQSPNLTSTLTLDMVLQSFKVSSQNNKPINNKSILIITNPLEVISPHYKIYEYIKSQCNSTIQHNVVFLNAINPIEKKTLFDRFKTIILTNYKHVETAYNKQYYIKEKIYPDKADKVNTSLTKFCNNLDTKDILTIAGEFSAISELILEQKHLFDEEFYKEVAYVEQYCKIILDTLFAFEQIFSCFIDFRIKQDKNNQLDEESLEILKNKVREQINKQNTALSKTAIYISHIINNAYFSNTPNNEIQYLNNLLTNLTRNDSYQKYKKIIEQYQSYPKEQRFSNTINIFIPFHKDIFLDFFSKDDFEELCKFMFYLIDLETGGVFLYYTHTCSLLSKQVVNISKQDLQKIVTKDLWEKFQNFNEDKIIEYLTDHIQNKFAAYLAELSIKDIRDKLKENVQDNHCSSDTMCDRITKNIITTNNINRLEKLIKVMEDYNKKNTEEKLNIVIQSFQEIQNLQDMQIPTSLNDIKNTLQHSLKSNTTRASSIVFGLSKSFTKKALPPLVIFEIYTWILDQIFPTISKEDLTRQITLFMLGMRGKKDSEYAKWEKGKPYFYIPKDLHKSLIIGDFMHSLLLDSSLDIGYCIHNPSIGAYTKNEDVAQKHFKDVIRNNLYTYNSSYFDNAQENESTKIYKEAHIKVHSYIDNIQSQNTHTTQQTQTNFQNLINKQPTQTKIKYQNPQNNAVYQRVGEETNSQRDFLIQLKRVAEYSYRVYKGEKVLNNNPKRETDAKDSINESILSNFIYNESFIPTKIDIHKEL